MVAPPRKAESKMETSRLKMTPSEHNKQELLNSIKESVERNKDFDYLFGGVLRQVFESAKGNGDFKGAVLSGIEQRLPSVHEMMDVDGDGGDAVDMVFAKHAKDGDFALLEDGLVGMLKAVGADVEDLEDVCLLRFLALNYGTINVAAFTTCVTTAITQECELDDVSHGPRRRRLTRCARTTRRCSPFDAVVFARPPLGSRQPLATFSLAVVGLALKLAVFFSLSLSPFSVALLFCLCPFLSLPFSASLLFCLSPSLSLSFAVSLHQGAIGTMAISLEPAPNGTAGVFATLKFADASATQTTFLVREASNDIVDVASTSYNFSKAGRAARASQAVLKPKAAAKKNAAAEINRRDMEAKLQEKKANASNAGFKASLAAMLTRLFEATSGEADFEAAFLAKVQEDEPAVFDGMDIDGDGGPTISDLFSRHKADQGKLTAAMVTLLQGFGIGPDDLSAN